VQVNAKMKAELRHIVLLLTTLHTSPLTPPKRSYGLRCVPLSNITLIFLPATTSIVQPLDQASFAFKAHYRAQLVQFVISTRPMQDQRLPSSEGVLEGTHYSNHPQLLVEGWHLWEESTSATVPCGATSQRTQVTVAASDAGDPEASASNDVVMQDAEVAPDTEVHGEAPAAGYEALEDLNSCSPRGGRRAGGWRHSAECH
jgi:hypothetical protein